MRCRRSNVSSDSLDLMLDIVSNTFGGVLFLAVLIAVLLKFDTAKQNEEARSEPQETTALESLSHQISLLQEALQLEERLGDALASTDEEDTLFALRQRLEQAVKERTEAMSNLLQTQGRAKETRSKLESLSKEIADTRGEVASLSDELQERRRVEQRRLSLPSLRGTEKMEFPVVARYGKLYVPFTDLAAKSTRRVNTGHFISLGDTQSATRLIPKPYAGIELQPGEIMSKELDRALAGIDSDTVYVAIGIWQDTFDRFAYLKQEITDRGFEYRVLPIEQGSSIQESMVKNPMVQ